MEIAAIISCYIGGVWFMHLLWWRNQRRPKKGYFKTLGKALIDPVLWVFALVFTAFRRILDFITELF